MPNQRCMAEFKDSNFSRTRIDLDGHSYRGCTFDECQIVYSAKGPVSMIGCTFNNCSYHFEGPAGDTLRMMAALYLQSPQLIEQTFDNIRGKGGLPPGDGTKWVKAG